MFKEVALVIDQDNRILDVQLGSPSLVHFPKALMWEQHIKEPGSIKTMAHTHKRMLDFSQEDLTTLKAWAMAFYPFTTSMDVIVYNKESNRADLTRLTYKYIDEGGTKTLIKSISGFRNAQLDNQNIAHPTWIEIIGKLSYAC